MVPFGRLLDALSEVPDPRRAEGKRYPLAPLLLFTVLALLSGATSYRHIICFLEQRRIVLSASLLVVDGKVQREGDVVHIVATRLHDGSNLLASLGQRDRFLLPHGRGDEVYRGSAPDARTPKVRDIYIPDLSLEAIRVKTRDFR